MGMHANMVGMFVACVCACVCTCMCVLVHARVCTCVRPEEIEKLQGNTGRAPSWGTGPC